MTPSHDAIVAQREKVDAAWAKWNHCDDAYEEVCWQEVQAEELRLDAMLKREKVQV